MTPTWNDDTVLSAPVRRTDARVRHFLALAAGLLMAVAISACGGGDGKNSGTASVSIDGVNPPRTYPGVETTVAFSIEPGNAVSESELAWTVEFGDGTTKKGEGTSGSVDHAWEQSGQYTVEVRARSGGRTVGSADEAVTVLSPIDLSVSNVRPRPANVRAGEQLRVTFDVRNKSPSEVATPLDMGVFLTRQTSVDDSEEIAEFKRIGTGTLEANDGVVLGAESTRSAQVQLSLPEDIEGGDYRLVPWIRPKGQFADENPDDNFTVSQTILRVSSTSGQIPDVAVEDVFVTPDRTYPALNEFQRGFTLRNRGGGEAFDVAIETYLSVGDQTLDEEDIQVSGDAQTYSIPPETSREIGPDQFVLDSDITAEDGEKEVYVIVRAVPPESSQDPNTDNNLAVSDPPIVVSDQLADGPDLVVESFRVSPEQTYIDGPLEVSMTIRNEGTADVGSFFCRLYAGEESRTNIDTDATFGSINVSSLASEQSTEIERTMTVAGPNLSAGTYRIYTYCDPSGALDENYRNNNAKIHPTPVEITDEPDIDVRVASLEVPETVQEGTETDLIAEVCVSGSNATGEFTGALYESTGPRIDFEEESTKTFDIPNIGPGECEDVPVSVSAECEDFEAFYSYGVEVDSEDTIPENDERNNRETGENELEVQGRFCKCTEDEYEENDTDEEAASIGAGATSAALCTPGEDDFFEVTVPTGETLIVETAFPAEKGSLRTRLFEPEGTDEIDADSRPNRQRVAVFNVDQKADYPFSVSGENTSSRNLYDLDVEVLAKPPGIDLIPHRFELERTSDGPVSIGATLPSNLRIQNIGGSASRSFDVSYVLTTNRTVGDSDDMRVPPSPVQVGGVDATSGTTLSRGVDIPSSVDPGSYYLAARIDPSNSVLEADDSNNVAFSRPFDLQRKCYDPLEPNDSFSQARDVSAQTYNNLTACASEEDYYRLCVQGDRRVRVDATYNPNSADLDLNLFDRHESKIASSTNTGTGSETVRVDYVNGDQCYYIQPFLVTNQQELETSYQMSITTEKVPASQRCDSHFEPNDTFGSSASLFAGLQTSTSDRLDLCPNADRDFYSVKLNQNQTVTLRGRLDPGSQSGTMRLQLYKPNETVTRTAETAPALPEAVIRDFTANTSGTYYLEVTTLSGSTRRTTYKLDASGLGGLDLAASNLFFVDKPYTGGESFNLQFDVTNLRSATATKPNYTVYLGDAASLDPQNDTELTSGKLGSDVPGNTTQTEWTTVTLPQNAPTGSRYVHVEVRPDSNQSDPNTSNNVVSKSIDLQ